MDGFFSQLPCKCLLEEVASVGDCLNDCPQLDSRVGACKLGEKDLVFALPKVLSAAEMLLAPERLKMISV